MGLYFLYIYLLIEHMWCKTSLRESTVRDSAARASNQFYILIISTKKLFDMHCKKFFIQSTLADPRFSCSALTNSNMSGQVVRETLDSARTAILVTIDNAILLNHYIL